MDIGIFVTQQEKSKISRLIRYYVENGHILSGQHSPYYLVPTGFDWYDQRSSDSPLISPNENRSEIIVLENPGTHHQIRFYIKIIPDSYFSNPDMIQKNTNFKYPYHFMGLNLLDPQNYAFFCERRIIFLSCNQFSSQNLYPFSRLNFNNRPIKIFLTNWESLEDSNKNFEQFEKQIKSYLNSLFIEFEPEIIPLSLTQVEYSVQNNRIITEIFAQLDEEITIINKTKKEFTFRIIGIHSSGVGGTSFFHRLQSNTFVEDIPSTRGIDIHVVKRLVGEYKFIFQVFDMAGNERWEFLIETFITNCKGFFFFYDLTNLDSLEYLKKWAHLLESKYPHIPIVVIGTKNDSIGDNVKVDMEWMLKYSQILGHCHVSAKTGDGLEQALLILEQGIAERNFIPVLENSVMKHSYLGLEKNVLTKELLPQLTHPNTLLNQFDFKFFSSSQLNFVEFETLYSSLFELIQSKDNFIRYLGLALFPYFRNCALQIIEDHLEKIVNFSETDTYVLLYCCWQILDQNSPQTSVPSEYSPNYHIIKDYLDHLITHRYLNQNNPMSKSYPNLIISLDILQGLGLFTSRSESIIFNLLIDPNPLIQISSFKTLQTLDKTFRNHTSHHSLLGALNNIKKRYLKSQLLQQIRIFQTYQNDVYLLQSIENLAALKDPSCISEILPFLITQNPSLKESVCKSLNTIDAIQFPSCDYDIILKTLTAPHLKTVINFAEKKIMSKEYEDRLTCIKFLYSLRNVSTIDLLLVALNDTSEIIRLISVDTLKTFKSSALVMPLLCCLSNSINRILKNEIIRLLVQILQLRKINAQIGDIIEILNPDQKSSFFLHLIKIAETTKNDEKIINILRIILYFDEEIIIPLYLTYLNNNSLQIRRFTIQCIEKVVKDKLMQNLTDKNIHLLLQILEEDLSFNQLDIRNVLYSIAWTDIVKGLLYKRLPKIIQIKNFLSFWHKINVPLLYNIANHHYPEIILEFCRYETLSDEIFNTYASFFILTYPISFTYLNQFYIQAQNSGLKESKERLNRILEKIIKNYTVTLNGSQREILFYL